METRRTIAAIRLTYLISFIGATFRLDVGPHLTSKFALVDWKNLSAELGRLDSVLATGAN
jgi:hypothetical protein